MIAVKYFGAIAEKTKSQGEEFDFSEKYLNDLLSTLYSRVQIEK
jgi:molybdopterin synthase sulfur carrier subunit